MQEPLWRSAVPPGVWAMVVTFLFSRRVGADPAGELRVLRVGAAGALVLIALVAPIILARRESGRVLFVPATGREVLAAVEEGPRLVLAGPGEMRRLEAMGGVEVQPLAVGSRQNARLRVERGGRAAS